MAMTAQAYLGFIGSLPWGQFQFATDTVNALLLRNTYAPDYAHHSTQAFVAPHELANDTAAGGYTTGGLTVANLNVDTDALTMSAKVTCDDLAWSALTGTVRYVVFCDVTQAHLLIGCIDLGADYTYAAQPFELTFPDGVVQLGSA
jgi:hypothetical protein